MTIQHSHQPSCLLWIIRSRLCNPCHQGMPVANSSSLRIKADIFKRHSSLARIPTTCIKIPTTVMVRILIKCSNNILSSKWWVKWILIMRKPNIMIQCKPQLWSKWLNMRKRAQVVSCRQPWLIWINVRSTRKVLSSSQWGNQAIEASPFPLIKVKVMGREPQEAEYLLITKTWIQWCKLSLLSIVQHLKVVVLATEAWE